MSNKSEQLAFAQSYGATHEPHDNWWYTYYLNGLTIWPSSREFGKWRTARLNEEDRYVGHQTHPNLETALKFAQGVSA